MSLKYSNLQLTLISIILVYLAVGYPWFYWAYDIHGEVVDADTGHPIQGVILVARWVAYVQKPGQGDYTHIVKTREAVTDINGKYVIKGWGPKPRIPFTWLDQLDPAISVFKKGYTPKQVANQRSRSSIFRESEWSNKQLKLSKFSGEDREFASKLSGLAVHFDVTEKNWRTYRRTIIEMDRLKKSLRKRGVKERYLVGILSLDKFDKNTIREIVGEK